MIEFKILGTGGTMPTPSRKASSTFINFNGTKILLDAGEGCQSQLLKYDCSYAVEYLIITHQHGDHWYGIFGLLETWSSYQRTEDLMILVPVSFILKFQEALKIIGKLSFKILMKTINSSLEIKLPFGKIFFLKRDHTVETYGVCLEMNDKKKIDVVKMEQLGLKPGKHLKDLLEGRSILWENKEIKPEDLVFGEKMPLIIYASDGRPISSNFLKEIKKPVYLIHEATYPEELKNKAIENKHSTVNEALILAEYCHKLFLTHFGQRVNVKKEQEINLLKNVVFAKDGCYEKINC